LTAGIVLVDSAHEEQFNRYAGISPAIAERYATQDGRFDRNAFLKPPASWSLASISNGTLMFRSLSWSTSGYPAACARSRIGWLSIGTSCVLVQPFEV
jgi:hypothetical protein